MNQDQYFPCPFYEGRTAATQEGFTAFFDEDSKMYYFAMLDAEGKVLLKSESYPSESVRNNGIDSVIKNRTIESHYTVKQENETYYLSLRAANYREIARSCSCETEKQALALLPYLTMQKVRSARPKNEEDNYLACSFYQNRGKAEEDGMIAFFDEETKAYFFVIVNTKGEVLFRSESYPNAGARDNGMASVRKNRETKERYSVKQDDEDGKYYLMLKAANHKEIARSCGYDTEEAAWNSLNPNTEAVHDDYMPCEKYANRGDAAEEGIVSFFDESTKGYYFSVLDKEGKVMFRSEHYPNAAVRDNGIASVRKNRNESNRYATIKDEKDGQYYVILKAGNHKEIARSCPSNEEAGLAWLFPLAAAVAAPIVSATPEIKEPTAEEIKPLVVAHAKPIIKERIEDYLSCSHYANQGLPDVEGIVQFFDVETQSYLFSVVNAEGKTLLRSKTFASVEARKKQMDKVRQFQRERNHYDVMQDAEDKRYYVVLKDADGDEIARSCAYQDKDAALAFLPIVPLVAAPAAEESNLEGAALIAAGAALVGASALIPTSVPEVEVPAVVVPPVVVEEPKVVVPPVVVPPVEVTPPKVDIPPVVPPPTVEPPRVEAAAIPEVTPAAMAAAPAASSGFNWMWLLPLLLILPLIWFLMKGCNKDTQAVVNTPVIVDTVKTAPTPAVTAPPVVAKKDTNATAAIIPSKSGNIILHHIFFNFDKADILPPSETELEKLIKVLNENPKYSCELRAFTDAKGSDAYNKALSLRRANNAMSYLTKKGVDKKRIKTSTFGEANPIAKNEIDGQDTEEGRKFNRRVEIYVLDENGKPAGIVENIAVPQNLKQ